jgi:uncharacterized membrane protein
VLAGRWTVKDVLQGKPLKHPSHALFVHFPSALLPIAFLFDVLSRFTDENALVRAAFYNVCAGLLLAVPAIITGLVDYLPMVRGSRKRHLGTNHLRGQLLAMSGFVGSLLLRLGHVDAGATPWAALAFAAIGVAGIMVGNYFGGELVYRQGMRVSTDL